MARYHSNVKRKGSARRAAVTVEFAFVLPIFLLFVFSVIEFARLNEIRHAVDNAAYEAARKAIVPGADAEAVESLASDYLDNVLNAKGYSVEVSPNPITEDVNEVTVTVGVPLSQNLWASPVYGKTAVVTASSTLRTERYRGIPVE
jgi:Flp pilus assembly protein TadG